MYYADASALARAYLADEPGHAELRSLLLETSQFVVTSELSRVELASAAHAAGRTGRRRRWRELVHRIERDFGRGGPVKLLGLTSETVCEPAYQLVLAHGLRALDAIHIAVALEECPALDDDVVFVTRDADQAAVAKKLGLALG